MCSGAHVSWVSFIVPASQEDTKEVDTKEILASLGLSDSQITTLIQGMAYVLIICPPFLTPHVVTIPRGALT